MINKFFKSNWQTIAAIAVFLIISCAYFSPALDGYSLKMGDIQSWKGMSKELKDYKEITGENAIWTNSSFSGMPGYQIVTSSNPSLGYVLRAFKLWLPRPIEFMFLSFLSFFILGRVLKSSILIAGIGALAYGFMSYNFLIIEAGHTSKMYAIAIFPGVLAGFLMIYRSKEYLWAFVIFALFFTLELFVNHIQMTYYFAFVLLAVGIAEFIRFAKEKNLKEFFKRTAIIIAAVLIAILANFSNYYNTYQFAKKTMRGKEVISISANQQTAEDNRTVEQKKYDEFNQTSGLKRDYITQWSYGKAETWNLIFPTAKGDRTVQEKFINKLKDNPQLYNYVGEKMNSSRGKMFGPYWGDQPFTGGPNYVGAIIVFLALLYLIFVQTALKWILLCVTVLTIMLSWGINLGGSIEDMWLTNFFIDNVPLYSKFRAVSSILVIINLVFPLMAILYLNFIVKNYDWAKKNIQNIAIAGGVIILVMVIVTTSSSIIGFSSNYEKSQLIQLTNSYAQNPQGINPVDAFKQVQEIRHEIFMSDAWRSIGLMVLVLGLILLIIYKENFKKIAFIGIALLILIDMWGVSSRYFSNEKDPRDSSKYIAWEKNTGFENTFVATQGDINIYQIEAAAKPEIQKEANDRLLALKSKQDKVTREDQESVMFSTLNLNTNYRVMDLDNSFNSARVSYFHKSTGGYNPAKLKRYQDIIDFYIQKELSYLNTGQFDRMKVLNMLNNKYYLYNGQLFSQNTKAYGNAWFVNDINWVEDNNAEILAIENTDVKHTAIIHNEFKDVISDVKAIDSNASIKMLSYAPNHISYESNATQDGLAVFSEIYYKDGWNAYLDTTEVPYARANYILRALSIPKGKHIVHFKFEPTMYKTGKTIDLISFLIILGALIVAVYFQIKKRNNHGLE
jgi:hypothetical protein